MQKKLSLGISDFKRLIEGNYYYVDKSLFIKEILDSGAQVTLLPRPRRFGKTINISMLQYFFEKTKESNTHLFKNLKISKEKNSMKHQGQYPVIFITFKSIKSLSWEACYNSIKKIIAAEFRRHSYLLKGTTLDKDQKIIFKAIIANTANQIDYETAFEDLTAYLNKFHKKRPFIFVDEYDAPIHAGYVNEYYKEAINFMRNFLCSGLKDNSNLEKSVLTGILRISKESIFSGLNNLNVCSIIGEFYAKEFGFL